MPNIPSTGMLFEPVYTHPLGALTVEQFKDALKQVARLAQNFGGSCTSTDWAFQGGNEN